MNGTREKHTPAWANARGTDESGNLLHAVGGDGWPENAVDRSRMIAAAPDLLAALNNTADALEVFAGIAPILREDAAWKAVVGRARAAIEKATL